MPAEAIVAGHICLDLIPALGVGAAGFQPGKLIEAGRAVVATGGAVSNTGLALHKLGVPVRLLGKVGDDEFGGLVARVVDRHGAGLGAGLAVASGEFTSYTVVISPPGSDRMFLHAPGCNDTFSADDLADEALAEARLMHFGYPTLMKRMYEEEGGELLRVLSKAKAAGLTVSLDMSLPDPAAPAGRADWRTILARCLPFVDLFVPSAEELLFMLRREDYDRLAKAGDVLGGLRDESLFGLAGEALALGARVVLVKAGHRGVYLRTGEVGDLGRATPPNLDAWQNLRVSEGCYRVDVVGTTGSGDTTIAGFLMAWLRGLPPQEALRAATAVGACCCEAPDALGGIRSWEETKARIDAGWSKAS